MPSDVLSSLWWLFRAGAIVFAALYFVFSLIVVRQVRLMTETVTTEVAPGLQALSIFFAGVSLAIIVLFIWLL